MPDAPGSPHGERCGGPRPPSPFKYAIPIYFGYTLLGAGVLAYLGITGRDAWLEKARLAMDAR